MLLFLLMGCVLGGGLCSYRKGKKGVWVSFFCFCMWIWCCEVGDSVDL